MVNKEDIMARRDEIMARREELMERAAELRERFQENVTADVVTTAVGWSLVSTGIAMGVTLWMRGKRGILALFLPIGLLAGGAALLGNGYLHRRGMRIENAEAQVRDQLAALDPVGRMQVLRDVGRESMPFVRHAHN